MTHRALVVLAIAAAVLAVVAVAILPLLHHDHPASPISVSHPGRPPSPPVDQIATLATAAATRALACRPVGAASPSATSPDRRGWCGRLTLTRLQAACRTQTSCEVEAIGTFTTPDVSGVVAVAVDVQRTNAGSWQVLAVRS